MMTANFKGILKRNEPLAGYTAWHIGGPAEIYYKPVDVADLSAFVKSGISGDSITFLGLGSNVLIADEGIKGTLIHWLDTRAPINLHPALQSTVQVDTRVPCAKLAKFCAKQGLTGAEFFAGIPGTVGGALAMNAGAWGRETWSSVQRVRVINRQCDLISRDRTEYQIGYRSVLGPASEWFVSADLCFEAGGDPLSIVQNIKALLKQRQQSQPIGLFSCGSVFKNPHNDYAGRLIESCGLKGYAIGGAKISEKHGNFIINTGAATSRDVRALIAYIQAVVLAEHQVELETELRFLGFEHFCL